MKVYNSNVLVNVYEEIKRDKKSSVQNTFDYSHIANSTLNVGYLNNKKIRRLIIYLRGKGCEWSCTSNGGCFMCGHYFGTAMGAEIENGAFYSQFVEEYSKHDFSDIPMICIYNAGSILNENEIPRSELIQMLELINDNPNIERIILESRPEFIEDDILSSISATCPNKIIEIGIGLETSNDEIRAICINKGFDFTDYLMAVKKIRQYRNIKVLTYLTVKPMLLTIMESLDDVVSSIIDISTYSDIISLEPVSIQKSTLIELLYREELYTIAKGWLIKDIIETLENMSLASAFELRLGGFEFFPIPELVISNCSKCDFSLYRAIELFNTTKETKAIKALECSCYSAYNNEKDIIATDDLYHRLIETARRLSNAKEG